MFKFCLNKKYRKEGAHASQQDREPGDESAVTVAAVCGDGRHPPRINTEILSVV